MGQWADPFVVAHSGGGGPRDLRPCSAAAEGAGRLGGPGGGRPGVVAAVREEAQW